MKNFLVPPLLLAALLPVSAAPNTNSKRADVAAKKRAMAMIEQSMKAYANLRGVSMNYTSAHTENGKTTREMGLFAFDRTGRSRHTVLGKSSSQIVSLVESKAFPVNSPDAIRALEGALQPIPSQATYYFADLVLGQNPYGREQDSFQRVRRVKGGVSASIFTPKEAPYVVTLLLDPTTHLLRRAHVTNGKMDSALYFSNVRINPVFSPSFFAQPKREAEATGDPNVYWNPKIKVGTVPLPISGTDLSGIKRDLAQYKGKVLLVDFWATWCGPCVRELPGVLASHKKYGAQGFEVLAVSLDSDKKSLTDFVAAQKMPWPQLFDGKEWQTKAVKDYGVQGIPFTLLIGKDGRIAAINPRGEALEPAIKAALAG